MECESILWLIPYQWTYTFQDTASFIPERSYRSSKYRFKFCKNATNLFAFDMMDCRLYLLDANSDDKIRTPAKFPMKQQVWGNFANIYLVLIRHLKDDHLPILKPPQKWRTGSFQPAEDSAWICSDSKTYFYLRAIYLPGTSPRLPTSGVYITRPKL